MTKKHILLSTLILITMHSIMLGMESSNSQIIEEPKMLRAQTPMFAENSKKLERRLVKLKLSRILGEVVMKEELNLEKNDEENKYSSLSSEKFKEIVHAGWEKNFPDVPLRDFKESYTKYEKNSIYGYPQLPLQPTDFSHINVQQYEEDYQKAIDRQLNATITQQDIDHGYSWPFYTANNLEKALLCNLHTIKQQQEINEKLEEAIFAINVEKLSQPIADFIMDFKTWPKEEQSKIVTFRTHDGRGYFIDGKPAASDKYEGSIGFYLDCRLTGQQITPFLDAIDYLKKQQ